MTRRGGMRKKGGMRKARTRKLLQSAFHEIKHNPPKILASTREKFGEERARKQAIAIGLSKARQAGAKLPKFKRAS